eukprot:GHVO01064327.1.p3 GENE.GHVO01064327.1~~GHVO01064327.1.p3  ORF type:complete len:131 (-),score=21.19 GHVO01064327.1:117-509(-)
MSGAKLTAACARMCKELNAHPKDGPLVMIPEKNVAHPQVLDALMSAGQWKNGTGASLTVLSAPRWREINAHPNNGPNAMAARKNAAAKSQALAVKKDSKSMSQFDPFGVIVIHITIKVSVILYRTSECRA